MCRSIRACLLYTVLTLVLAGTAAAFSDGGAQFFSPDTLAPLPAALHYRGIDYPRVPGIGLDISPGPQAPPRGDAELNPVPGLALYGMDVLHDLYSGTEKIFSRDNLPLFLTGSALGLLTAKVDHADRRIKNYFQERRPMHGLSRYGDIIGQGYGHVGIGAALFAAGELSGNKQLADTGVVVLESFLVNGAITEGMKYASRRLRPNGGDHLSFPSGHVSSTAALAASISEMYDWDPLVAVPLYATVAFVGASRIQDNAHYLSDVIAGVTLGTIVGTSFAKYHKEKDKGIRLGQKLSFTPVLEKNMKGGIFTMKW